MSRTARAARADVWYHVMTRGNARQAIFHDQGDFDVFTSLLHRATARLPTDVLAWCLMPNHVHLLVRPRRDGDLGPWMHWLMTSHVHYHQRRYATVGRIWQGRFKASPIQVDVHLLIVLRYIERNPVRAGLVADAMEWPWSSAPARRAESGEPLCGERFLVACPVDLPQPWSKWVNEPITAAELAGVRQCVQRDRPYGDPAWVAGAADRLGLRSSLNPRGRPRSMVR